MEARAQTPRPRFWVTLQPSIVRLYKVAGLIALTAILVGLIGFLVVNVFYFFDHSWVRPERIEKGHHKVIEASTQLADAKLRLSQFNTEKIEVQEQLAEAGRVIAMSEKFVTDIGTLADAPKTPEQWLVHREVERAKLEKENATGKRVSLNQRAESLQLRIVEQEKLVKQLALSPFLRAVDAQVVLAFVPNDNDHVKVGTKLYGCSWGLVACSNVGKVSAILEGEVTNQHPHNESVLRGIMVEIDVSAWAAGQKVLFAGSKPLWLF